RHRHGHQLHPHLDEHDDAAPRHDLAPLQAPPLRPRRRLAAHRREPDAQLRPALRGSRRRHRPPQPRQRRPPPRHALARLTGVPMSLDAATIEMVQNALIIALKVTAPILAAGVLVGLIVSILQAVTSIQDQTVAIVPKIIVMVVVAILLAGWIMIRVTEY